MGQNSAIEWTDHTFNPWWGCTKISPACAHCYAEPGAKRFGVGWGDKAPRRFFDAAHWKEPERWNVKAAREGKPAFVFCASYADVCELLPRDHPHRDQMQAERYRLRALILRTPWLRWLLLTKRPENFELLLRGNWPANAWAGVTAENQQAADLRLPILKSIDAPRRFVSYDPALGPVDFTPYLRDRDGIDWLIAGGESGRNARPMHPAWARAARDQAEATGADFFFKQWGEYAPDETLPRLKQGESRAFQFVPIDGGQGIFHDNGRFTGRSPQQTDAIMSHVGKKYAGRLLDGREWNERPEF